VALLGVDSRYLAPAERSLQTERPLHAFRVVYEARVVGGTLAHEVGGSSNETRWVPLAEIADLHTLSLVPTALELQRRSRA